MSKLPINLPGRIIPGRTMVDARWANSVREAIARLATRKHRLEGAGGSGGATHPFQLLPYWDGATPKLRVRWGLRYSFNIKADSTSQVKIPALQAQTLIGPIIGAPDGIDGTPETLAVNTTYGVWIKAGSSVSSADAAYFRDDETAPYNYLGYQDINVAGAGGADEIIVSSTYTSQDDMGTLTATTADYSYVWIGKVTVGDANTAFAIEQWLRSDIIMPAYTGPAGFKSADSGNALTTGSDGNLYVAPPVSSDSGNDIAAGTDGGAYLDLQSGTGATVSGSPGSITISAP